MKYSPSPRARFRNCILTYIQAFPRRVIYLQVCVHLLRVMSDFPQKLLPPGATDSTHQEKKYETQTIICCKHFVDLWYNNVRHGAEKAADETGCTTFTSSEDENAGAECAVKDRTP